MPYAIKPRDCDLQHVKSLSEKLIVSREQLRWHRETPQPHLRAAHRTRHQHGVQFPHQWSQARRVDRHQLNDPCTSSSLLAWARRVYLARRVSSPRASRSLAVPYGAAVAVAPVSAQPKCVRLATPSQASSANNSCELTVRDSRVLTGHTWSAEK